MKRKFIIVGSIFVLILILLMPSIPAIQQKTIEDKAYSDFIEEIKTLDDDIKFLLLYAIIVNILLFRYIRGWILFVFSYQSIPGDIAHPLLWLRGYWLLFSLHYMIDITQLISDKFGLNWKIEIPMT